VKIVLRSKEKITVTVIILCCSFTSLIYFYTTKKKTTPPFEEICNNHEGICNYALNTLIITLKVERYFTSSILRRN